MKITLRLDRGETYRVVAVAPTDVWAMRGGLQDILQAELGAGEETIIGPYLNATEFRIESSRAPSITNQAVDFAAPVSHFVKGVAVAEASDETDVTDRFNELLTSLRAGGLVRPGNPLIGITRPEITGTTEVGETLSVDDGVFSGDEPITYAYQWTRGDGELIEGATSNTYELTEAELDISVGCTVTATNPVGSLAFIATAVGPITTHE